MTVCGTALGGALFGRAGHAYFGGIEGFDIKLVKKADSAGAPAVIVINGFLTGDDDPIHEWQGVLWKHFPKHRWYHVAWESKRLRHLGQLISQTCSAAGAGAALGAAALKASKKAWQKFAPFHALCGAADLVKNPWHVAFLKAQATGRLLADILSRVQGDDRYVLLGHSLGSSVIFWTLNELATQNCDRIDAAYLFGGAVGKHPHADWEKAARIVAGPVRNYHSFNDHVLKFLYRAGTFFASEPVGYGGVGLSNSNIVVDHDVSQLVDGHCSYKKNALQFFHASGP